MANIENLRRVQKQEAPESFLEELGTLDITEETEFCSQGAVGSLPV